MFKKRWYYAKFQLQYVARWSKEYEKGFKLARARSDEEAIEKFKYIFELWVEEVKRYSGWKYVDVRYTISRFRNKENDISLSCVEHVIHEEKVI